MDIGKGWDGQKTQWVGRLNRSDGKITVGVCAREKKARSKHMEAITSRLNREKFEVIVFGDACIMDAPVEDWPLCDCLVAFYSTGFPSDKAEAYVKLRRPYALNNLEMQDVLHDRRRVYDLLKSQGVPHPENVYASRDGYGGQVLEELDIVEADDYIQVKNMTIHKPFVEKPVDAENHNVYIYYPMSAGGGSKRLFRKIGDRSSEFYPNVNEIRREGSFVYESFVETQGTDVKVYTVGPDYGHAEARKSPTLDGKVNRNAEGKEIRYPVILTSEEKEYARKITLAFRQCVCGFDILRVQGRSYVCDVNGWSFVKNSRKYVDDCAMLLQEFIEAAVKPGRCMRVFSTEAPLIKYQAINIPHHHHHHQLQLQQQQQQLLLQQKLVAGGGGKPPRINTGANNGTGGTGGSHRLAYPLSPDSSSIDSTSTPGSREVGAAAFAPIGSPSSTPPRSPTGEGRSLKYQRKHPEELRAVIAIIRHGDRTPKQKMKMKINFPEFLAFYNKYSPGPRKEIKVKGKLHLKEFLGITVELIKTLRVAPSSSASSSPNGEGQQQPKQKQVKKPWSPSAGTPIETAATASTAAAAATADEPVTSAATTATKTKAGATAAAPGAPPQAAGVGASISATPPERQEPVEAAAMETKPSDEPGLTFTEVDYETYGKLHQIKHVLERWEISGINRKLQLKPRKWEEVDASSLPPEPPRAKHRDKKANYSSANGGRPGSASALAGAGAAATAVGSISKDPLNKGAMAAAANKDMLSKGVAQTGDGDSEAEDKKKGSGKIERATQLLLILKWGGELTNLGQRQAIELGNSFRTIMYPDSGTGGLLRLHSTFRHDLKIKTSDEGRVMKTAAAFAKGFLELEGDLTPILVSLVSKESSKNSSVMMLDPSGNKDITKDMDRSKDFLQQVMAKDVTFSPELIKSVVPTGQASVRRALRSVGNPVAKLTHLRQLVMVLVKQLSRRSATFPLGTTDRVSAADRELDRGIEADEFATSRVERAEAREKERKQQQQQQQQQHQQQQQQNQDDDGVSPNQPTSRDNRLPARGETPLLMLDRWRKLHNELYDSVTGFDITKIPDVHDNVRYDCLHNAHLELDGLPELYDLAKQLADSIVPQEYGITKGGKLMIGSKMCHALLDKIKYDLLIAMADSEVDMRYQLDLSHVEDLPINSLGRRVRTRLYFTSESHLHTFLNVLRFPIGGHEAVVTEEAKRMLSRTKELCYLTSFVIRLFEDAEKGPEDPARFRVEILFSPGVVKHPMLEGDHLHTAPLVPLHKHLTCKQLVDTLNAAIALSAHETVPDDHSEAEAILHKLDKVVRQGMDRKGSGGGAKGTSGVSPTAATPGNTCNSGAAAAAAAAEETAGASSNSSAPSDGDTQGAGGTGRGGAANQNCDDHHHHHHHHQQQQAQQKMNEVEVEELAGERQFWYYGGGSWGKRKGSNDKDEEKEKEKKPRSWLSSVTRSASTEPQLPTLQKKHQPRLSPEENPDGGGGGGGGVQSTGNNSHQDWSAGHPKTRQSSMDGREPGGEEGHPQHQLTEGDGCGSEPGADGDDEENDVGSQEGEGCDGDDEGCADDEEEERTDDGDPDESDDVDEDVDDEDDIDEDDEEGFESDVGRDAQARLASDSFLSLRCENEFFNMDSFSSNAPDEDRDEEEGEDGAGQEEQREHRGASLGGRPRSREYRRGASNGGGSSKRGLARRAAGVDGSADSGGHALPGAAMTALGVLGAAAAVAVAVARSRRA